MRRCRADRGHNAGRKFADVVLLEVVVLVIRLGVVTLLEVPVDGDEMLPVDVPLIAEVVEDVPPEDVVVIVNVVTLKS